MSGGVMRGHDDGVVRIMMLSSMVDRSDSVVSVMVLGSMVQSGDVVVLCSSMVNRDNNGMVSVVMLSSVVCWDNNGGVVDGGSGMMSIMVLIVMSDGSVVSNGGVMNWRSNVMMGLHG